MTAPQNPRVTPRALAEVACTLSLTASEVCIDCETRKEAEEVLDWLEAHVGHREAAEAASKAREAALVEALGVAHAAMAEYYRYWTGGETRGSYDGKPERNALWSAMHKTRAALTKEPDA